ncbi:uncharacterized protein LOC141664722 [Apium graveolens]|uniref:uncharacterized protein LOC141664722 n=1 Tax=Apium graveolens TaxID=4045 RepID=UPI003D7B33C4
MRLSKGKNADDIEALTVFAKWVLDIGDGNISTVDTGKTSGLEFEISIPPEFCNVEQSNSTVSDVNDLIIEKIAGDSTSYFSIDKAEEFGGTDSEFNTAFPVEHLNSLKIPGVPHHELKLKDGVVVMLMRNLNQTIGLCNGTRMMFYVAISRVTSPEGLKIFVDDENGCSTNITKNVVYKEVLYNVPVV